MGEVHLGAKLTSGCGNQNLVSVMFVVTFRIFRTICINLVLSNRKMFLGSIECRGIVKALAGGGPGFFGFPGAKWGTLINSTLYVESDSA